MVHIGVWVKLILRDSIKRDKYINCNLLDGVDLNNETERQGGYQLMRQYDRVDCHIRDFEDVLQVTFKNSKSDKNTLCSRTKVHELHHVPE